MFFGLHLIVLHCRWEIAACCISFWLYRIVHLTKLGLKISSFAFVSYQKKKLQYNEALAIIVIFHQKSRYMAWSHSILCVFLVLNVSFIVMLANALSALFILVNEGMLRWTCLIHHSCSFTRLFSLNCFLLLLIILLCLLILHSSTKRGEKEKKRQNGS